jgi:hypothetical protein
MRGWPQAAPYFNPRVLLLMNIRIAETAVNPTTIRPTGKLETPGREHATRLSTVRG